MSTIRANLGVSDLTLNAFFVNKSGYIWNGSSFVDPSGLTPSQYEDYLTSLNELTLSDSTKTGTYLIPVPAGIAEDITIELYRDTWTLPHAAYWLHEHPYRSSKAIYDAAAGEDSGTGAYSVTITVVDGSADAVENASVRLTLGGTSYLLTTNSSGQAVFSCDAGTWTVNITAAGMNTFTPVSLTVSGVTTKQYTVTLESARTTYAEDDDLFDIFGRANVKRWANMEELATSDSDYETTIAARITKALQYATEDIDELLRGGGYEVPFEGTGITKSLIRCCALKAGAWLFEWRRDNEEADARYADMERKADKILEQIRKDVRRFDQDDQTVVGTRIPGVY